MSGPAALATQILAKNLFSLEGRTCLVTGGATGIGLMITHALATNGGKVYIVGRREEELKKVSELYSPKDGPGSIIPFPGDITSKETVLDLAKAFGQKENALHLLVNNAGVAVEEQLKFSSNQQLDFESAQSISDHLLRSEFETWQQTMQTNVAAVYFMSAAFLPLLEKGHASIPGYSSSIINITSISGIMKGPSMGQFAYAASKAAANQVTRSLANTLVKTKVRVNAIAPGIFPSEMTTKKSDENNKSQFSEGTGKGLPAGRGGNDEDMAGAILLLASKAGVWYNAQIIHPDGGALLINPSSM